MSMGLGAIMVVMLVLHVQAQGGNRGNPATVQWNIYLTNLSNTAIKHSLIHYDQLRM